MRATIFLLIFIPALAIAQVSVDTVRLLVPEFFHYEVIHKGDTSFTYQCYDSRDSIINELTNFDEVWYVSVIKRYTDHTQTYRDDDKKEKPLPIEKIIYRYDRTGNDRWQSIDYADNSYRQLQETKNEVLRVENIVDEKMKKIVRCTYYKVTERKY